MDDKILKPGSPVWNEGKSGNSKGAPPSPRISWKQKILRALSEETPEAWRQYGATKDIAAINKGWEMFMQGKFPNFLIDVMKYSEPSPQEVVGEIRSVHEWKTYGVDQHLLVESVKDILRQAALSGGIEIVNGQPRVRELPEPVVSGEFAREPSNRGASEDRRGEEGWETPVVSDPQTTTPN